MEKRKNMIEEFNGLLEISGRIGFEKLIEALYDSDFYKAPASTKHHGAYEGGLLEHSLNVYYRLDAKSCEPIWEEAFKDVGPGSIIIIALLHDLCKMNYYGVEMKNKKVNGEWVQEPSYYVKDDCPYGHGEKSVMLIEQYIELTEIERFCIRWHMGAYEGQQAWGTLSKAIKKYPIILATHEADMEATYIMESEK